jgi:hypothetical protein
MMAKRDRDALLDFVSVGLLAVVGAEGGNFLGRPLRLLFPITYDSKDTCQLN